MEHKSKVSYNKDTIVKVKFKKSELRNSIVYIDKPFKPTLFSETLQPGYYYKDKSLILNKDRYCSRFINQDDYMLVDDKVHTKFMVNWIMVNNGVNWRVFTEYDDAIKLYNDLIRDMNNYEEEY